MSSAGYTMVEVLVAIAILGLAMAGLAESTRAVRLIQSAAVEDIRKDRTLERARRALDRLFGEEGPFRSDDASALVGGPRALSFHCGSPAPCRAELVVVARQIHLRVTDKLGWSADIVLPGVQNARLLYGGPYGPLLSWPVNFPHPEMLASVTLTTEVQGGTAPLVIERLWREQPADCAYDPVLGNCRRRDD